MSDDIPADEFAQWMRSVDARLTTLEEPQADHPVQDTPAAPVDDIAPISGEDCVVESDIRAAYRLLLDREPDAEGFATYLKRAANGLSRGDLVGELLDSNERVRLQAGNMVEIDLDGGVIVYVDRTERDFGRTIARDQEWETHVVRQILAHLEPGAVFVDIGANVGVMSFHAAKAVGPTGKVIAFEPNPDNVQRFLQGVDRNGFEQVRLYPMAASARHGIFSILGGSNTHLKKAMRGARLVASLPADSVLEFEPRVDLIKIDIEGHEPLALAGLAQTLRRLSPLVLCEFNPRCLRAARAATPDAFAATLFAQAAQIDVIEHDGSLKPVATAVDLMALWAHRNAQHVAIGDLADGMVHFDLLISYPPADDHPTAPAGAEMALETEA